MDYRGILEAVDNSNGSLLWRIEYNPIPAMYSDDYFSDIKTYNDSLYIIGPRSPDGSTETDSWQINKRSIDGLLVVEKITDSGRSKFPHIFADETGVYVFGGGFVEKYDHDLNLVWSKTFGTGSITAVAKNGDFLYLAVTDGYLMYGIYVPPDADYNWYLKVISSSTGD